MVSARRAATYTLVVLITGCGRVGYDPQGAALDASQGALEDAGTNGVDASTVACSSWGPFTPPLRLALSSGVDDWCPSLSSDGRTLYFASYRAGGLGQADVWLATRPDLDSPFGSELPLSAVNSPDYDGAPYISPSGLELYLYSNRAGSTGYDLWVSTRDNAAEAFSAPTNVAELNLTTANSGGSAWLSSDGLRLYGDGWPQGESSYQLYVATRPNISSPFGAITLLSGLNTNSLERKPSLTDDELEIVFQSDAPGGAGTVDLWIARRDAVGLPFQSATPIAQLNSPQEDVCATLSRDGTTLLYNYDSNGVADLWMASRSCLSF